MPTPTDVRALSEEWGKPIWNTEEHVYKEGFDCEISLVQAFNKNFLESGATKIVNWYLVASVYGIEPFPITPGSMIAREPWSGNYASREVLWGYAHYGQFTEVGWQYLNGACGKLNDGGTYVTLKSPKNDYSIIIETKDASMSQQVDFIISDDLSKNKLCVWRSNTSEQFVQLEDIAPVNGVLTITLDPKSIYSISTTSGQRKGTFGNIPESKPFPFPYYENFESYKNPKNWGYLPHYTADIAGVFEIAERPDKKGNCLRQVIGEKAQSWAPEWRPYTVLGDQNWTDYEISADIYLDNGGMAGLMGRLNSTGQGYGSNPKGYYMGMNEDGLCALYLETQKKDSSSVQLATGKAKNVTGKQWHNLKLQFLGSRITGFVDNVQVLTATDATFLKGMVGMITGGEKDARNTAYFDNLIIKPIGAPEPEPTKFIQDVKSLYR
jgi:galactosylceramidase